MDEKKKGRAPIACLYAAPGFFGRRRDRDDLHEKDNEPAMEEVYAAPEFFRKDPEEAPAEEPEKNAAEREEPACLVYAAPGYFRDRAGRGGVTFAPLYAAPDRAEIPEPEEKPYPASFEEDESCEAPETCEAPEACEEPASEAPEACEAPERPAPPEPPFDPAMMMCVYAGPDFYNRKSEPAGQQLTDEQLEEMMKHPPQMMGLVMHDPSKDTISGIGMGMGIMNIQPEKKPFVERENGKFPKFCRECGNALEEGMKYCPGCGAKIVKC